MSLALDEARHALGAHDTEASNTEGSGQAQEQVDGTDGPPEVDII